MKKLLLLLAILPGLSFADGWQIAPVAGTPRALPTPGTVLERANITKYGEQIIVLGDGSGGAITPGNTVNIVATPGATSIVKAAGTTAWASTNDVAPSCYAAVDTSASISNVNGKYGLIGVGQAGALYTSLEYDSSVTASRGAVQRISVATDTTNGVVAYTGTRREDTLAANSANASGNYLKTDGLGALWSHPTGGSTGGSSNFNLIAAATTNSTNIKASAGSVYSAVVCGNTAAAKFVKFYNKATAPTCGTDTPVFRMVAPASGCALAEFPVGLSFATGIGVCATGAAPDADATALAANDVSVTVAYN